MGMACNQKCQPNTFPAGRIFLVVRALYYISRILLGKVGLCTEGGSTCSLGIDVSVRSTSVAG
jgi:hypothetical protein